MKWWKRIFGSAAEPDPALPDSASGAAGGEVGSPEGHIGHRRAKCWWEPIYNPSLDGTLQRGNWDFSSNSGPSGQFLNGAELSNEVEKGDTYKLAYLTFRDCDFQGDFRPGTIVMFDKCKFIGCDFAFSTWKDTNFRDCTFEDCSLSLATFERCEFRDNFWLRIGISGSKTEFIRCFVTNPSALIMAGFSGRNPNDKSVRHRLYQWHRLQGTKAHLSRTLLLGHEGVGDDQTFYQTARLHDLQQSYAKISRNLFEIAFGIGFWGRAKAAPKVVFNLCGNMVLRLFGFLNAWGASVVRPLMCLAICYAFFGYIYEVADFGREILRPFQKSFDITALVGYGSHTSPDIGAGLSLVQDIHAIVAIILYTVFFATIVSKLSRVR